MTIFGLNFLQKKLKISQRSITSRQTFNFFWAFSTWVSSSSGLQIGDTLMWFNAIKVVKRGRLHGAGRGIVLHLHGQPTVHALRETLGKWACERRLRAINGSIARLHVSAGARVAEVRIECGQYGARQALIQLGLGLAQTKESVVLHSDLP